MQAAPATRGGELLSQAMGLAKRREEGAHDDISLQRLKRDIDKHLERFQTDKEGLTALAVYYGIRDMPDAIALVERLCALYPAEPIVRYNTATMNLHYGHLARANAHAQYHWDISPGDPASVDLLVRTSIYLGDLPLALAWADQWLKEHGEPHPEIQLINELSVVSEANRDADLRALGDLWELGAQVVREAGFRPTRFEPMIRQDDEDTWLYCGIVVDCDIKQLIELDKAFTQRVAETDIGLRLNGAATVSLVRKNRAIYAA